MELAIAQLSEILSAAFDCGYTGTPEQRDEAISDLLERFKISEAEDVQPAAKPMQSDMRVYAIHELAQLPVGTLMMHSVLGKCKVQQRGNDKYMMFDVVGLQPAGFNVDGYPWDLPMKRLS